MTKRIACHNEDTGMKAASFRLLQRVYNKTLRPLTPRVTGTYNGIDVKDVALFDFTRNYPNFEQESIEQLKQTVNNNDHVVVIGGGRGVSAVWAAKRGASEVIVYEAVEEYVDLVRDTADRNSVSDVVKVKHAVVGTAVDLWGDEHGAKQISPANIPECDVLELDCEGSELDILRSLGPSPRSIVIECHPNRGATENAVRAAIPDEYEIISSKIDEYDGLPVIRAELTK